MCHFVSWYQNRGKVFFLENKHLYLDKGKNLMVKEIQAQIPDDIKGHGAIKSFFGFRSYREKFTDADIARFLGTDNAAFEQREETDFDNPKKFPLAIQEAIKEGRFGGIAGPVYGLIDWKLTACHSKAYSQADKKFRKHMQRWEKKYQSERTTFRAKRDRCKNIFGQAHIKWSRKIRESHMKEAKNRGLAEYRAFMRILVPVSEAFWNDVRKKKNRLPQWK